MKGDVLIFGGTTEGRILGNILRNAGVGHKISVATEYGRQIELESGEKEILSGRLSAAEAAALIKKEEPCLVVDATHPFAVTASRQIRDACRESDTEYLRLSRDTGADHSENSMVTYVDSSEEAGDVLRNTEGNILLTTGSRDLKIITERIADNDRVYVRVLPSAESIELCKEAGIAPSHIIAMQGPFSENMNTALIREISAGVMLTKESGKTGGYPEKLMAASRCGIKTVVIRNPETLENTNEGHSMREVLDRIEALTGKTLQEHREGKRTITLAGAGPGDSYYRTEGFKRALEAADVVFGAPSVLDRGLDTGLNTVPFYETQKILEYLDKHRELFSPMVIYSGDISLSSGALKAAPVFEENGYEVRKIPGISSVALFAARLGVALEDARIVSAHGRECNIPGYALKNKHLFVLTTDAKKAAETALMLCDKYKVFAGCELGTDKEKLLEVNKDSASEISGKVLLYICNESYDTSKAAAALSDEDITRGEVPMTKEEIRALSVRKLELTPGSVFYDIGAGTGSVSLEAALQSPDIRVYSYERNPKALELLQENKKKFGLWNMTIIPGEVPDSIGKEPVPDRVFIGGSGKRLPDILEKIKSLNKEARIVINCGTLETLSELVQLSGDMGFSDMEVIQVSVTGYKQRGAYHLADAHNPIFIATIKGFKESSDE